MWFTIALSFRMNITKLLHYYQELSGEQEHQINEFVAFALLHVVHKHIMTVTPSLILILSCRNRHTSKFYNEMMSVLFRNWGLMPLQFITVWQNQHMRIPGRRHYNLIFTDSYEAFLDIDVVAYTHDYDYNEYYYIFLQARDHMLQGEMQLIFDYCWRHHLINCNVQIQLASGDILVYTYYPYGVDYCGRAWPQLSNRYNGSAMVNPELFPHKLRNFYGCKVRAALWHLPPLLWLEQQSDGHFTVAGGFEGRLLRALSKKLNFSIDVVHAKESSEALNMLHLHQADLSLGGLWQTVERLRLASSTLNHYTTHQVFGVLDTNYELSSLDILLYPYQLLIWLGIGGVLLLAALLQLAIEWLLQDESTNPLLNLVLIFVGMPMIMVPWSSAKRLYCIALMFYTLLIRTVYQALIYHLIRTHQLRQLPQGIDDLIARNYTVVLSSVMKEALVQIPSLKHMHFQELNSSSETGILDYVLGLRNTQRIVAATVLDLFLLFNRRHAMQLKDDAHFELIPQNVVSMHVTIYMGKHSYLIDQLNEEIIWMRSAGLIKMWARSEIYEAYASREQVFKVFGLDELYAIFALICIGLVLGILVLLLELLSLRVGLLRRMLLRI